MVLSAHDKAAGMASDVHSLEFLLAFDGRLHFLEKG